MALIEGCTNIELCRLARSFIKPLVVRRQGFGVLFCSIVVLLLMIVRGRLFGKIGFVARTFVCLANVPDGLINRKVCFYEFILPNSAHIDN